MLRDYFKTAVLGPIAAEPFSVIGSCAHCVAASHPKDAAACAGFGPGCLRSPWANPSASSTDDRTR